MEYREIFKRLPQLEAPRLTLRSLRASDERDMFAYACDPEVTRYTLWDAHRSREQTRLFLNVALEQYLVGQPSSWGIVLRETGRLIGTIGFATASEPDRRVELGYALGRAHWGHGLMTEALATVIELCIDGMGVNRIQARCDVRNVGSRRVMEKCGMRLEGTLREHRILRGQPIDCHLYALLAADLRPPLPTAITLAQPHPRLAGHNQ